MSDVWSLGPPPRNLSIPFPAPSLNANSSAGNGLTGAQCQANGAKLSSQEQVTGADVTLNPDGSITVANLKDGRGQPHTVYLPYQRQIVPGHNLRVYIDGLPLNPISHEHLWLAQRAREIGCDTQLRSELKKLARHELESLEALADALVAGREHEARSIFRRFRHSQHEGTNNFFKLAPPLRTLLLIRKTPAGALIDNSVSLLRMTYTVNSQGAVLSVYFDKKGIHIWDR
ncbi:MAG TPA: hypothetical protein PKZ32_01135 [Candidatus Melainabacteria bacterium]|nr:hypothetical protein [Candidatus Melainabacteria bacterium]